MLPRHRIVLAATAAAFLTACSGGGGSDDTSEPTTSAAAGDAIVVTAGDLYFEPTSLTAPAGTLDIELVNEGSTLHDLVIEEAGDTTVAEAQGGEADTGSIDLEPGTYTYYCSVPGHRSVMEGTLTVE